MYLANTAEWVVKSDVVNYMKAMRGIEKLTTEDHLEKLYQQKIAIKKLPSKGKENLWRFNPDPLALRDFLKIYKHFGIVYTQHFKETKPDLIDYFDNERFLPVFGRQMDEFEREALLLVLEEYPKAAMEFIFHSDIKKGRNNSKKHFTQMMKDIIGAPSVFNKIGIRLNDVYSKLGDISDISFIGTIKGYIRGFVEASNSRISQKLDDELDELAFAQLSDRLGSIKPLINMLKEDKGREVIEKLKTFGSAEKD